MMAKRRSWLYLGFLVLFVLLVVAAFMVVPRALETMEVKPPLFSVYVPRVRGTVEGLGFVSNWENPSAVVIVDDKYMVLDTDNDRVIVMDNQGIAERVIGQTGATAFLFKKPEGLAVLEDKIFVANTQAGEVVILDLSGAVERVIELPSEDPGSLEPRPTGIAVLPDGGFYVSDTANNVVLHYDSSGVLVSRLGAGPDENYTFSEPRGLTIDRFGSLYVADTLNGRVKKFSPEGRFLTEFFVLKDRDFSRPVDVAVGTDGTVYFSDRERLIIHVVHQSNFGLGKVGMRDATKIDSPSVIKDPYGLCMVGDRLYVMDREDGLFGFDIDPRFWEERVASQIKTR